MNKFKRCFRPGIDKECVRWTRSSFKLKEKNAIDFEFSEGTDQKENIDMMITVIVVSTEDIYIYMISFCKDIPRR